jgi:hypothetical protein
VAFTVLDTNSPHADANAYITVAEFNSFHTDRQVVQVVDGAYETDAIQGAIVKATDFIDKRFGKRFRGYKRTRQQSLEWPRIDAYDNDDFQLEDRPRQLLAACAEYALLALQLGRDLAPPVAPGFGVVDPLTGEAEVQASGQLVGNREAVGPIETEQRYAQTSTVSRSSGNRLAPDLPSYPQADLWIEELLRSSSSRRLRRGG